MSKQFNHLYEFGSITLDANNRLLYKDGVQLPVQPKVVETLLVLVRNAQTIVDKDTILDEVWKDVAVEEGALKRNISVLRKALGDEGRFIETLPKRGYRFTAEVKETREEIPTYTIERATADLILERRANLRITQEEEITDSNYPASAVFPVDRTIQLPPATPRSVISTLLSRKFAIASLAVVVLIALLVYWRVSSVPKLPATSADAKSMAVLPFTNLGADPEDKYLGIGLADVLITQLGRMRQIAIRPIGAVQRYADAPQPDPLAAGRDLGVETVLEGSVQHVGDDLRVTVRLLRVGDGIVLWSGKFDQKFTDIFSLQDSLSQQVAQALLLNLSREDKELLTRRYTNNVEAYQLYLKGRYFWNRRTLAGLRRSLDYFNQAIDVDATYALAYAGLADSYALLVWQEGLPPEEYIPKAKAAATQALQIDETLGEAHTSIGLVKFWYEWDFAGAEAEYRRAIELGPEYATAHHWYGEFLVLIGRAEEGFRELDLAKQADALSLIINADIGKMFFFTRQPDKAIEQLERTLEMDPRFPVAHLFLAMAYNHKSMFKEALAALEEEAKKPDSRTVFKAVLGYTLARAGRASEAVAILNELKNRPPNQFAPAYEIALIYVGLGKTDEAFEWLERARLQHDPFLTYIKMDPNFDPLRGDRRFAELLQRMGFTV